MKKSRLIIAATAIAALTLGGGILWASDHADATLVTGKSTDITDLYVFQGANTNNLVFVGNVQGLLSPAATAKDTPKTPANAANGATKGSAQSVRRARKQNSATIMSRMFNPREAAASTAARGNVHFYSHHCGTTKAAQFELQSQ